MVTSFNFAWRSQQQIREREKVFAPVVPFLFLFLLFRSSEERSGSRSSYGRRHTTDNRPWSGRCFRLSESTRQGCRFWRREDTRPVRSPRVAGFGSQMCWGFVSIEVRELPLHYSGFRRNKIPKSDWLSGSTYIFKNILGIGKGEEKRDVSEKLVFKWVSLN